MKPDVHRSIVKAEAQRLGFDACGIAVAKHLDDDAYRLEKWLKSGYGAGMEWMQKHFDLRVDPTKLVLGAKSVITLTLNYFPDQQQSNGAPKISKYAWGEDYHNVIRAKLNELLYCLKEQIGDINGRGFVDSAPVLERSWAVQSGIGWVGKNANLIAKQTGSFFFIATIITDLDITPDAPFVTDHCGTCTKCIDACPTEAIISPAVIDANKCISYLTIELKDAIMPGNLAEKLDNWVFGCDVCQDVCPWNRFSKPHQTPEFSPILEVLNLSNAEWSQLTEEAFRAIFKKSPIKRTKWRGMMRNINAGK